jgi:hypothetical protein
VRVLGVGLAFLVVVAATGGATVPPDLVPARLTLQTADVPAARLASQGPVHEPGYQAAYQRTFTFATPNGGSGFRFVQSESLVAGTVAKAARDLGRLQASVSSKAGRAAYAAAVAKGLGVKPAAVRVSPPLVPRVGDRAIELPISVVLGSRHVYESVLYLQLDHVLSIVVSSAVRSVAPGETRVFAARIVSHIDDALKPRSLMPPSAIGDAVIGSVLTGTSGDWAGDATFTFQWQRCEQPATTCTDVAGATAQTYAVSDTDVGFALRVSVTATNRFGASTVSSAPTPAVEAPPPPPPPDGATMRVNVHTGAPWLRRGWFSG